MTLSRAGSNIHGTIRGLPEELGMTPAFGPGAGPGPIDHYGFEFYALNTTMELPVDTSSRDLEKAMNGHIVGKAKSFDRVPGLGPALKRDRDHNGKSSQRSAAKKGGCQAAAARGRYRIVRRRRSHAMVPPLFVFSCLQASNAVRIARSQSCKDLLDTSKWLVISQHVRRRGQSRCATPSSSECFRA